MSAARQCTATLVALLLCGANAHAASPASTPAPAELVATAAQARKAAATERARAAQTLTELPDLAAQRKQQTATIAETRRALAPHLAAANAAAKSHEVASKAGKQGPAELALLEKSRAEYAAADALFTDLTKQTASLRGIEDALAHKQEQLRDAASTTQAKATQASASVTGLQALAKSAGDAAQKASTAAGSAARAALAKAGIVPKAYPAARAKADAEDKKLALSLATVEQALNGLQAPPKPPAPKQCDLRKMDWAKRYPSTSEKTSDGSNEFGVENVSYPDLEGDGVVEALVLTVYSYLGLSASQRLEWTLVRRDSQCSVEEVASFSGAPCASVEIRGKSLIFDNLCGEDSAIIEYQLVNGKLQETKRRKQ